jgi:hypothetical protein
MSKLVDRPGEPLGDLSLLVQLVLVEARLNAVLELLAVVLQLPVAEEHSDQHGEAAQPLEQRRPGIVLQLEPVVLQLMARDWISHVA